MINLDAITPGGTTDLVHLNASPAPSAVRTQARVMPAQRPARLGVRRGGSLRLNMDAPPRPPQLAVPNHPAARAAALRLLRAQEPGYVNEAVEAARARMPVLSFVDAARPMHAAANGRVARPAPPIAPPLAGGRPPRLGTRIAWAIENGGFDSMDENLEPPPAPARNPAPARPYSEAAVTASASGRSGWEAACGFLPPDIPEIAPVLSDPLSAAEIEGDLQLLLRRLGANAECRKRWEDAARANQVSARYLYQLFSALDNGVRGFADEGKFLRTAVAGLLSQIVAGDAGLFSHYGDLARESLGHCLDRKILGLNSMLTGKLHYDIEHGAFDTNPRGLDKALRSLFRYEALRTAGETRLLENIIYSDSGPRYRDEPVELHLALQCHFGRKLGLPAILRDLNYPFPVNLTATDYHIIGEEVREKERREYGIYLAAESPHWLGVMSRVDPVGYAAAGAAREKLYEQNFKSDVRAYCEAHPEQTQEQAEVAVSKAQAWEAYAPLMKKHLAPHGLWPVTGSPLRRWWRGLPPRVSALLRR